MSQHAALTAAGSDTEARKPLSRKGVRTRARLVEAAKRVFERDGFLEDRKSTRLNSSH